MTETALHFAPMFPWPSLAAAALVAAILLAPSLARGERGAIWRAIFLAALLLAMANPLSVQTTGEPLPNQALLVIDRSASQSIGQRTDQTDRAVAEIREMAAAYPDLELREVEIGSKAGTSGTELFAPLGNAISAIPREQFAGAIVLTDGIIHDNPTAGGLLGAIPAPIHALITGDPDTRDRRLIVERAPEFALVDRPFDIVIRVEDSDRGTETRRAEVTIRVNGKEVFRRDIRVDMPWPVTIHPDNRGAMLVEVETSVLDGEASLRNNRKILNINAVRDRLRVLLISGEPHPGERIWRSTLKSDPAVDLIHFTILKLPTSQDNTPVNELALIPFPTEELFEAQLERFDLVIFDRYTLRGVLQMRYLDNLAEYVRSGGAILVSTGPEFRAPFSLSRTPLARVLPALPTGDLIEQGFVPKVTDAGRRHPVTSELGEGDWGRWFRIVAAQPVDGDTLLAGADDLPLLVLARSGEGRVAQLLSDQVWLWARGIEGGGPYSELLRRTVHWLMQEPDLEEEALAARADEGFLEIERRSLDEDGGTVSVTDPAGLETSLELAPQGDGRSIARMPLSGTGVYRVTNGSQSVLAGAGELNPREFAELIPRMDIVADVTRRSGGSVRMLSDGMPRLNIVPDRADKWGRSWIGLAARGARNTLDVTERPLIPGLLFLAALLGLIIMAWWRETR